MDRGAARSKKRALKAQSQSQSQSQTQAQQASSSTQEAGPSNTRGDENQKPRTGGDKKKRNERQPHIREAQSKDPSLYVPKAIRTSAALIYSKSPFDIPPSSEVLANVRRIDLSGSDTTDVSWLKGTNVTWLSLNGCQIENGWEEVGELKELAVLNINGCGLKDLPPSLGKLSNLKAIVAMNNEWTTLDEGVVEGWKELNSLIISHSPNLTFLPSSLSKLYHLSKLTFSHCPKLTSESLPDLTNLPLLRDVKMNNLPLLTKLPPHIATWGKGDLNLALGQNSHNNKDNDDDVEESGEKKDKKNKNKYGDGLEVLDLGNCSLSFESISDLFNLNPARPGKLNKSITWANLRSLSLHSNPLTVSNPNYVELLKQNSSEGSGVLPNLQIIDAKRIIERKRKGEIQESRLDRQARERKENRMKGSGSGSNMSGKGTEMRKWGGANVESGEKSEAEEGDDLVGDQQTRDIDAEKKKKKDKSDKKEKKSKSEHKDPTLKSTKKRKHNDQPPTSDQPHPTTTTEERSKKRSRQSPPPTIPVQDITDSTKPSQEDQHKQKDKSGKQRDAVIGLIDINSKGEEVELNSKKKKKMKAKLKKGGDDSTSNNKGKGIDLREVFGKKDIIGSTTSADQGDVEDGGDKQGDNGWGSGLGVGGW